jgi:DNA-binding transcriptional ArsR family regulator
MNFHRDFANPIVAVIEALASDERRRILIELEEKGSLSYSEILQRTELSKGTLNYHLKLLAAAGMTRNFIQDEFGPYSSYYEISEFGRNVIENLLDSFRPPSQHIRYNVAYAASVDVQIYGERKKEREVQDMANAANAGVLEMAAHTS